MKNRNGALGLETTKQVIISFLILAVTGVAIILALTNLQSATTTSIDTTSYTTSTISESGFANTTGYTLSGYNSTWSGITINSLSNRTDTGKLSSIETGGYLNTTGYSLAKSTQVGFSTPVIIAVYNYTSGQLLTSGNYTLTGFILTNATTTTYNNISINYTWTNSLGLGNASVSSAGVVTNGSTTEWNNLTIGYYYTAYYNNGRTSAIVGNVTSGIVTFFGSTGTIFSILVVVIIILAISIIIWAVGRFGQQTEGVVNL